MSDLISIIVASYNHAEYLNLRMSTLINQTYKNLEIIVIDDCSTDSSPDILKKYENVPKVKLIFLKKNMGYPRVCNYGVSLSLGEYIMMAECDDFNDHRHIEILHKNISRSDQVGVVYSRSNIVNGMGNIIGDDFYGKAKPFTGFCSENVLIPRRKMQRFLLKSCVIPNMSAALFRRKYFNAVSGFSESFKVCADWDFWCRMAKVCDFYYVAGPLNNFRRHPTTVRAVFGLERQFFEIFRLLHDALPGISLNEIEKLQFKANLGYIFAHELIFSHGKDFNGMVRVLRKALEFGRLFSLFFLLGFPRAFADLCCYKARGIRNKIVKTRTYA